MHFFRDANHNRRRICPLDSTFLPYSYYCLARTDCTEQATDERWRESNSGTKRIPFEALFEGKSLVACGEGQYQATDNSCFSNAVRKGSSRLDRFSNELASY